ncbi:MAG TPA: NAD(P)-binding domain-containing protein [Solirubrobacterales bacterium]|nr:NAD(P)-binding domain-containing protein [Solirubrobacterales bacterium]
MEASNLKSIDSALLNGAGPNGGGRRVCVIGAGSSGLTAMRSLKAKGIEFTCFEKGSWIGGNWKYDNDNGQSAAYRSLHINTSRQMMEYAEFPMPKDFADYPDHFQIQQYFEDFADHFGLRDSIAFQTEVVSVVPAEGGGWDVSWSNREDQSGTEHFSDVIVCNGHHWDKRWPEPAFPGSDSFEGVQMHAHDYRTPDFLAGKRVLVLGIGNSATDIAVESSRHAEATFLAMRRGAWVVPKYIGSKPTDQHTTGLISRTPIWLQSLGLNLMVRMAVGKPTDYGLPKPDHKLLHAHPTVSQELYNRLGHGDIKVKPNIERLDGDSVIFDDGSREKIDVIVYCTGYKITFPFLAPEIFHAKDNQVDLYRHVVAPDQEGLYFIGLIQPLGAIMPLAEVQCDWVADLIDGSGAVPDRLEMTREIALDQAKMSRRFVKSKRHTVEVDFADYLRELKKERKTARERARSIPAAVGR